MIEDDVTDHFQVAPGYWFMPKIFGFGATPVTWRGRAVTVGLVVPLTLDSRFMPRMTGRVGVGAAPSIPFAAIRVREPQGGWAWHWRLRK